SVSNASSADLEADAAGALAALRDTTFVVRGALFFERSGGCGGGWVIVGSRMRAQNFGSKTRTPSSIKARAIVPVA
ncbi:MAG TPA: hypothetical protein VEY30_05495, partial [Myxococcaceae bacterium]|nr:hypothetical protein [Myxococcaceae bacterium]